MAGLREHAANLRKHTKQDILTATIEDTYGPNPCQSLMLTHEDGSSFGSPCNGKRCIHCGPRKKAIMWQQTITTLGDIAYVGRINPGSDPDTITKSLERAKKDMQRKGIQTDYTIVGDATLGYIITSNTPIHDSQRRMALKDWRNRILDMYHHSVQRIRRSRTFGRMSLIAIRRKSSKGQPSPWAYADDRDYTKAGINAIQQAEIDRRDSLSDDVGWHVWQEGGKLMNTIQAWQ